MKKFIALGDTPTTIYTSSDSDDRGSFRDSPPQMFTSSTLDTDDDLSYEETLTPFQKDVLAFIQRYSTDKGFHLSDT